MRCGIFEKGGRRVECVCTFCVLVCGWPNLDEFEAMMDAEVVRNGLLAGTRESNQCDEHDEVRGEVRQYQREWMIDCLACRVSPEEHASQVQKTRPFPLLPETRLPEEHSTSTSAAARLFPQPALSISTSQPPSGVAQKSWALLPPLHITTRNHSRTNSSSTLLDMVTECNGAAMSSICRPLDVLEILSSRHTE